MRFSFKITTGKNATDLLAKLEVGHTKTCDEQVVKDIVAAITKSKISTSLVNERMLSILRSAQVSVSRLWEQVMKIGEPVKKLHSVLHPAHVPLTFGVSAANIWTVGQTMRNFFFFLFKNFARRITDTHCCFTLAPPIVK